MKAHTSKFTKTILSGLVCAMGALAAGQAIAADSAGVDLNTLTRIRDAALEGNYSYDRLAELTDRIGPRLSGSPGAAAAVELVAQDLRDIGLQVNLQPVKVPHWVRGVETAELVDYPNRPAGISQRVTLTALGSSAATPAGGIVAPLLVVHSMDELHAHAAEAKGSIVVFDVAFDQQMADIGRSGNAYGESGLYRFIGPATASKMGAVAALVRSVGGANFRIAHTGVTGWMKDAQHIPAGALTAEDAMLISRLAAKGPVKMHLTLTPQTLPDADSFNVIGDLPGGDKAADMVLVSGHLDSWDLAQGATDDGTGVMVAMGVAEVLHRLGLKPRRTVRVVAWMNEENGQRGEKAYFEAVKSSITHQFAAIESDGGAGHPLVHDASRLKTLESVLSKGVGFGTMHYGVEIPEHQGGQEFVRWQGGYFLTNWSVNPHWTADFTNLPNHEITRGVRPFKIRDEWYYHMKFADRGVTPILAAIPPDGTRGREGADDPHGGNPEVQKHTGEVETVVWAFERPDGGRGFGFTGAHDHRNWGNENFRKVALNAILWIAKVPVPQNGVECSVTPEDLLANLDPKEKPKPKTNPAKVEPFISPTLPDKK